MLKPALQLKLGQQLTMTPQLQQAIKLLQLPVVELNIQIQQALAENVMLELDGLPDAPAVTGDTSEMHALDEEAEWLQHADSSQRDDGDWASAPSSGRKDGMPISEFADRSGETLREHLHWQLEMGNFAPREFVLGEAIIDAINDDGYLTQSLEEIQKSIAASSSVKTSEVEHVLAKIQQFDPLGVGARDLAECIGLQLRQFTPNTPGIKVATQVAADYLDLVASQETSRLRRELRTSDSKLEQALILIRRCHPKPGLSVAGGATEYVIPDVFVRKVDGQWTIEVSNSNIPKISVNQRYAELLRNDSHSALKGQLQEARWLVRSLEIRHDTLLRVASAIVARQRDFFEHGEESMKPMVLRDIAQIIDMHESTISRVTANKYMHTPRGVLEFRYFFSSNLTNTDGDDQSAVAVRAKIRKLIGAENPAKPLSDNKLTLLLSAGGVKIARRTVAKYRESMNIPSSSERKVRTT